ncbi:hypothetical protein [Micromonospora sp. CA-246542]|uniref:hypothetical protein n=1 Tax=Micromonospora sp. CA-246542 TaxID=3239959 RepID=UPI003D8B9DB0
MKERQLMADDEPAASGFANLRGWNEQQATDYESARLAINAVIGAYSARLGRAVDADQRAELLREQRRYSRERQLLTLDDQEQIQRILRDYPKVAQEVSRHDQQR